MIEESLLKCSCSLEFAITNFHENMKKALDYLLQKSTYRHDISDII